MDTANTKQHTKLYLCLNVGVSDILEKMLVALDAGQHQARACLPNMYNVNILSVHHD